MAHIVVYENEEFGTRDYLEVFFEEDFVYGHPALPPYATPTRGEDGHIEPIQVNSAGGYCHHVVGAAPYPGTRFVEYRDYDMEADEMLPLSEMYPVNRRGFNCGWIAPDGTTYQCAPEGHSTCADRIANELFDKHVVNGERVLEERGWLKVYHDSEIGKYGFMLDDDHGIFWDRHADEAMTAQQISVIKRIGRWTEELQAMVRMFARRGNR